MYIRIVNIIRDLAKNYELSRRDYDVMSRLCIHAEKLSATMTEWMKTDMTGDSDYPTTWDCFMADHPEVVDKMNTPPIDAQAIRDKALEDVAIKLSKVPYWSGEYAAEKIREMKGNKL